MEKYKNIINFIQFYIQNFTKAKLNKNKITLIINIKINKRNFLAKY